MATPGDAKRRRAAAYRKGRADLLDELRQRARRHAIDLEQCSLFVDSAPLAKAMTDAAAFCREIEQKDQP